jgi:Uma2 family endonuclease
MKRATREIVLEDRGIIPNSVVDHASFRRWAASPEFPETGQYGWLDGKVWVDLSMERSSHNLIKTECAVVLAGLAKKDALDKYWGDRMLLTNLSSHLSTEPDGTFATWQTLREGRLRVVGGEPPDGVELLGSPDVVLEVVSRSSVRKDYDELPDLYFDAGIAEYWRIGARGRDLHFHLLRRTATGYRMARDSAGWRKSVVFGTAFRLTQTADPLGDPSYTLEMR